MKKIIIIGAGGNSKVIIDIISDRKTLLNEAIQILGFLDDDTRKKEWMSYPVLGSVVDLSNYTDNEDIYFINGIGDNSIRKKITLCQTLNIKYYTAIHPSAIIGSCVTIGKGTVIMPGAIINAGTQIGDHAIINTGAIIEHDNSIDDYAHIASGAITAGNVCIGQGTLMGTGSKVIQGISIGNNSTIGAGSVVIKNIPPNSTAVGIPAKVIKGEGFGQESGV